MKVDTKAIITRFGFLEQRPGLLWSDDFKYQFEALEESVDGFKSMLHKIEGVSIAFQWEVVGYAKDAIGNEQEQSGNKNVALAKTKLELTKKLQKLTGIELCENDNFDEILHKEQTKNQTELNIL